MCGQGSTLESAESGPWADNFSTFMDVPGIGSDEATATVPVFVTGSCSPYPLVFTSCDRGGYYLLLLAGCAVCAGDRDTARI